MAKSIEYNELRYRELFIGLDAFTEADVCPDFLRAKADAACALGPWTVTAKPRESPSRDPHDYFSLSRYYHPNPDTPDGWPYVARDGVPNPEIDLYDVGPLSRLVHTVQLLSIAYGFSRDSRYAARVAELLSVWFVDPLTRMNPHMNYAQYIPGREGVAGPQGCPPRWVESSNGNGIYVSYGGAIEGACLPLLLNALRVFEDAPELNPSLWKGLVQWFDAFLDWLLNSPLGLDEKNTPNNHAIWYRVQVISYAVFVGRREWARNIIEDDLPLLLNLQMKEDGALPQECWRAIPLTYICFALSALLNIARLGEEAGVSCPWTSETEQGRSIPLGVGWLARHIIETPISGAGLESKSDVEALCRMVLAVAIRHFPEPIFHQAWSVLPPWPQNDERGLLFDTP